jgi:hypothetical protein
LNQLRLFDRHKWKCLRCFVSSTHQMLRYCQNIMMH